MLEQIKAIITQSEQIDELPFTNYDGMIVYDYYDRPLNFAFLDDSGNYYISNLFEWDKQKNIEFWVCVPVTESELSMYEKDHLSMKDLFNRKLSEGVYIYVEDMKLDARADVYFTG